MPATSDRRRRCRRRVGSRRAIVSVRSSGVSPNSTRTSLDIAVRREAAVQRRSRGAHRVAGAARRILDDALGRRDGRGDRVHAAADHDDRRGRLERLQRVEHMADHRPPGDRCMTLGIADFIRVPSPAARMMAAKRDWLITAAKRIHDIERAATVMRTRRLHCQHTDCCGI